MEPVIWVEILSRHHDVTGRHRCSGDEIRIGRGYDNDVIIDDPNVAAHHLRLHRDGEQGWVAEDLGTANGLYAERGKSRLEHLALDGNQIIRIGRTLLRVRASNYPVTPEHVVVRQRALWPAALAFAVGIVGIELASSWLAETAEPRLLAYLGALQFVGIALFAWIGFWTILCRVFTGQALFERHALIALGGVFSYSLFDEIIKLGGFALFRPALLSYEFIVFWSVLGLISTLHLGVILPRRRRLTSALTASLAGLAIVAQGVTEGETHRNVDPPPAQGRLYPPFLRLAPAQSEAQFFDGVAQLQDELKANREDQDR